MIESGLERTPSSSSSFSNSLSTSLAQKLAKELKLSSFKATSKYFTCLQNFQVLFNGL